MKGTKHFFFLCLETLSFQTKFLLFFQHDKFGVTSFEILGLLWCKT